MSALLRGLALAVLVSTFAGCASGPYKALDPATQVKVTASQAIVSVKQSEIYAAIQRADNGAGGLLGALTGSIVEESETKRAEQAVTPLRDALLDYDFDGHALAGMQAQLPKVDWLHLSTVTFTKAASSDAYDKLITDAQVPYTLIVRLDYHLSWDLKLLLVTATAQLLPKPTPGSNVHQGPNGTTFTVSASDPSNIIYTNTVTYVASIPDGMLSEHASFKEAAPVAMPYWSKDHAAVTRAALADAAAEVSRLVALSLQNPGKTADVKDEVAVGPEEGHILEKQGDNRVVIQFDDGSVMSTETRLVKYLKTGK
jgi:hypothetical protein